MNHIKELIEALPGVEFVHITTNRTWEFDKKTGLAPQSFKIYVLGGKKREIAQVIWNHKIIGVLSQGTTKVKIRDSFGFKHVISFERLL